MLDHLVGLWEATSLSKKEKRAQQFATQLSCIKHDAEGLNKEHSTLKDSWKILLMSLFNWKTTSNSSVATAMTTPC